MISTQSQRQICPPGADLDRARAGAPARDLVFTYWHETWTDSVQRQFMTPDRFVQTLLSHERVAGLLIADPYRMGASQIARRLMGRRSAPIPQRAHPTAVASPLRLRRRDGTGEARLRATYAEYDRRLGANAAEMGLSRPAVITTNPFYAAYAPLRWAGPVTYYAFDDWAGHDGYAKWWSDYRRAYQAIRTRGHRVCAVSQHLLDRLEPTGPAEVVANGVTPSEWRGAWQAPEWLRALPRPWMLYTGSIHSRLDLDAVRDITARIPEGSLIFVGPIANAAVARELAAIPTVSLHEPTLDRAAIAGLTRSVDVCIMPHRRTLLTESMSPLKIYEYCAAGRPVAATDMSPVRGIHRNVVLVPEGASFADGVQRALAKGPMSDQDRNAFIDANAWARRHDAILDLALSD
ncbi:MAG TPA: glycosyltransferase [Phenylobacterium sp.]|jgi:hypothetical protein